MGRNDSGRVYDGIDTLLRDRAQVERLSRLTERSSGTMPRAGQRPPQPSYGVTGWETATFSEPLPIPEDSCEYPPDVEVKGVMGGNR